MFASWQTSVMGVVAIFIAGLTKLGYITPEMAGTIALVLSGLIGLLAKDRNVTGGTKEQ